MKNHKPHQNDTLPVIRSSYSENIRGNSDVGLMLSFLDVSQYNLCTCKNTFYYVSGKVMLRFNAFNNFLCVQETCHERFCHWRPQQQPGRMGCNSFQCRIFFPTTYRQVNVKICHPSNRYRRYFLVGKAAGAIPPLPALKST